MRFWHEVRYPLIIFVAWITASWHWVFGHSFIPWDSFDAFFPQVAFIRNSVMKGQLPTWNPLLFSGLPILGDPQGLLFTPHTVMALLSGPVFGLMVFDITTLLCMLGGALCLYRYTRMHGSHQVLATLGAIVFMLGGYATSRLQHTPQIISLALLPVLLLAFRVTVQRPAFWPTVALCVSGTFFALNQNQVVFLAPFMLAPLFFLEFCACENPRAALKSLVIAAVFVVAASTPSLSALLEVVDLSTRQAITLEVNRSASLPASTFLSMFIPGLYGVRAGTEYWGPADMTESYLYIGIIPFSIIMYGLLRRQAPSALLLVCWVMALASFLFAMGLNGPLFPIIWENIPGFAMFRRPSDGAYFLLLFCALSTALTFGSGVERERGWIWRLIGPGIAALLFCMAVLSVYERVTAQGQLNSLMKDIAHFGIRAATVIGVLGVIWLVAPEKQRMAAISLALLIISATDLGSAGRATRFAEKYANTSLATLFRVLDGWETKNATGEARTFQEINKLLQPGERIEIIGGSGQNANMALGIANTQGYNPIVLQRYFSIFRGQHLGMTPKEFTAAAPAYDSPLYKWLGLRYVLIHDYILTNADQFGAFGAKAQSLYKDIMKSGGKEIPASGSYRIIKIPQPYPRASLIPRGTPDAIPERHCEVIFEGASHSRYKCLATAPMDLVIGDAYAPGWSACMNGKSVGISPFLGALRTIEIPSGESRIDMRYQPVPFLRFLNRCSTQ